MPRRKLITPFHLSLQIWRIQGLIRLYVGFLLFTLSDAMNPAKREYSFEQWYMFYFYDLQIWEKVMEHEVYGDERPILTNLGISTLFPSRYTSGSSLGATLSSTVSSGFGSSSESQVAEVARRVGQLARQYWFLLDHHAMTHARRWEAENNARDGSSRSSSSKLHLAKAILQYVNWLPMNPETNSVARLYMKQVGWWGFCHCVSP